MSRAIVNTMLCVTVLGIFELISIDKAYAKEHLVEQLNKSFVMNSKKIEKLEIKVGDTIRFRNEDVFFHNVFSLSDLKTFDLGSFPKGQSKVVEFDKAGKMEIECAIHPQMYLEVVVK